jgi:hypothetical protein
MASSDRRRESRLTSGRSTCTNAPASARTPSERLVSIRRSTCATHMCVLARARAGSSAASDADPRGARRPSPREVVRRRGGVHLESRPWRRPSRGNPRPPASGGRSCTRRARSGRGSSSRRSRVLRTSRLRRRTTARLITSGTWGFRVRFRSRGVCIRRCTGGGCGRCGSSRGLGRRRRRTSVSATYSSTGRRGCRPLSICRP